MEQYSKRDDHRVGDSIMRYIEFSDPVYKKFKVPLLKKIDELKGENDAETFSGDEVQGQIDAITKQLTDKRLELRAKYLPTTDRNISKNIKKYFSDLHQKINQVLNEIKEINQTQLKIQQIPRATINKLFDVFQEELKRQNDQRTQSAARLVTLQSMGSMIEYMQQKYVDDFNTIFFNILLAQEKRNHDLTFNEIEEKIDNAANEQSDKYDQYNQSVSSADA